MNKYLKMVFFISFLIILPLGISIIRMTESFNTQNNEISGSVQVSDTYSISFEISDLTTENYAWMVDLEVKDIYSSMITFDFISDLSNRIEDCIYFEVYILGSVLFISSIGVISAKRSKIEKDTLTLREQIHEIIKDKPGIHFRELCRELNKKNGVLQYNLHVLEDKEFQIRSYEDGKFTRYFDRQISMKNILLINTICMMKRTATEPILRFLSNSDEKKSRNDIATELNKTPQAISTNIKKLNMAGLVDTSIENKKLMISLKQEVNEIIQNYF